MPSPGSAPMKWSLTGWSDWTYCVQSAMSEVGLKGERAVCDEAPPIHPALHGGKIIRKRDQGREVTGESISVLDGPGTCRLWLWARPLCPPSPILAISTHQPHGVVSGAAEGEKGETVFTHNLTVRSKSRQRVPYSCPKCPTVSQKPLPVCMWPPQGLPSVTS